MGKRTVHVSDFSGRVLQPDDEVVRVVVLEHPDLVAGPVQLEATPDEIEGIDDAALDVAVVEIYDRHGGGGPRRVVLTASEFDELATEMPMAQLLRTAERVKPPKATRKKAAEPVEAATVEPATIEPATVEPAGAPQPGAVTEGASLSAA